jgi:anti-sigma factor RsiW
MHCDRVRLLLNGYVDGELDLVSALDIEQHMQGCAACTGHYRMLMSLQAATGDKSLYRPASARLEKRVRASLRKAGPASPPLFAFSWSLFAPVALLAVVVFVLGGVLGRTVFTSPAGTPLAEQVQMAHVRSLMAGHLLDVASTDQHTVKPWFDGKLDFSPPVTDLAAQGYPLIGGRLDYLEGQPAAALVYQRAKHIINLFIWPSTDQQTGVQSSTDNGYHLFHWDQSGMTFWAVSDLNSDELGSFVQLFQNATK